VLARGDGSQEPAAIGEVPPPRLPLAPRFPLAPWTCLALRTRPARILCSAGSVTA